MLLDIQLERGVATAAATAELAERAGFAGVWAAEVTRDPMLALAAASTSTRRVTLGSNVVLAFARNPMSVAQQAWDLAEASEGRFLLGLASQVKPHITRRYSMPFTDPVERMREFVLRSGTSTKCSWASTRWTSAGSTTRTHCCTRCSTPDRSIGLAFRSAWAVSARA